MANQANKGSTNKLGGAAADAVNYINEKGRKNLWIRARNSAQDKCSKRANLIYTKGTGRTTKCPLCCQVELLVDDAGVTFFLSAKIFYGTCDETIKERQVHFDRDKIHAPGFMYDYTIGYFSN